MARRGARSGLRIMDSTVSYGCQLWCDSHCGLIAAPSKRPSLQYSFPIAEGRDDSIAQVHESKVEGGTEGCNEARVKVAAHVMGIEDIDWYRRLKLTCVNPFIEQRWSGQWIQGQSAGANNKSARRLREHGDIIFIHVFGACEQQPSFGVASPQITVNRPPSASALVWCFSDAKCHPWPTVKSRLPPQRASVSFFPVAAFANTSTSISLAIASRHHENSSNILAPS